MAVVEIGSSLNFANFNQIKLVQIRDKLCSCNCYPCNLRRGEETNESIGKVILTSRFFYLLLYLQRVLCSIVYWKIHIQKLMGMNLRIEQGHK